MRVLSPQAFSSYRSNFRASECLISAMQIARKNDFIFPGMRKGKPLSNMSMLMLLRRMRVDDSTIHGLRSSFRDWAGEETHYPREVVEAALAHVIGDKAQQA